MKVVDIRNATGYAVGQFPRHGVFRDCGDKLADATVQLLRHVATHRLGQGGEAGGLGQFMGIFREVQTQCGEIVFFSGHGIAENDGRAVRIQRPFRITVVFQGLARASDRPFLGLVHGVDDPRRDRDVPLHWLPWELTYPAADLRVSLVRRAMVRIVIKRRVPTVSRNLADAVTAVLHILPERLCVRSIGQDRSNPNNGNRATSSVFHG